MSDKVVWIFKNVEDAENVTFSESPEELNRWFEEEITNSENAFDDLFKDYNIDAPPVASREPTQEEQIERACVSKTYFSEWLHYVLGLENRFSCA